MTVRIAQFVRATHDVVDEAFLREFPEVEAVKADSLESLADALDGAEILHAYNSAFTPEFARLVRKKGRSLKWIQFTTVGIEIALKAGLPDGVWVTNSGDVNQRASAHSEQVRAFLIERITREMALKRKNRLVEAVPQHESFIERGFDYQEAELAAARARHSEKARTGNRRAIEALEEVKAQQRLLSARRNNALAVLRHEPELIEPGEITFIAHALVVPSSEPADREQHDANVEMIAMKVAHAFEEAAGATVKYVHTPELARAAGLPDHPGFDLLSIRSVNEKRAIEVKGRAGTGEVEVLANEWAKACNMRQGYWLYAVYDCATPSPRLARVQDPFGSLLAKAKGSMLISAREILMAAGSSA